MRLWDFFFLLLVVLPLVTGGLWFHRPGIHLEYTQPGLALVALGMWAWWMAKRGNDLRSTSRAWRWCENLWSRWAQALRAQPRRVLFTAWLCIALAWFVSSLQRHLTFHSGAADLGIFTNVAWNVSQLGWPYSSIKGGASFLTDHQMFVVYPLGWLFALWPKAEFLLLLQAFGLASGGIALYLLGRQRLGPDNRFVPWLPWMFWLYPPVRAAYLFDFHPEVFLLPLLLFSSWLLQENGWRKRGLGLVLLFGALGCKESAGPVVAGLGLAWALGAGPTASRSFTRKAGLPIAALGAAAFFVDTKIVPGLFGTTYAYTNTYSDFGASPLSLLLSPFLHPLLFAERILGWSRLRFLLRLLFPLGFLPLLAPVALLAALPGFLMLFLTTGDQRLSSGFHYGIEPGFGLFFALSAALASAWVVRHEQKILLLLPFLLLLAYGRSEPFYWRHFEASAHQKWLRNELLPALDTGAQLSASSALVPHVAARHWVHFLPVLVDQKAQLADCVLWERSVNNTPMNANDEERLTEELKANYSQTLACETLTLYSRNGRSSCLQHPVSCRTP